MNTRGCTHAWPLFAVVVFCAAFTLSVSAQVETKTTTSAQKPTVVTKVERGEVVTVSGNDLVVKMADGTIRHIENVPESVRVTVDGKQLGIHDLKPGMKLQRTITTTTTPKTITTVQSVKGKIWAINPPLSVILTLEDGKNQQFKIPENQKFNVGGQIVDAWGLRKGMTITATKVVEVPTVEVTQKKKITGEAPPEVAAAEPPPPDVPVLVAEGDATTPPAAEPQPASAPPQPENPSWPSWLTWVIAFVVVVAALLWFVRRKRS